MSPLSLGLGLGIYGRRGGGGGFVPATILTQLDMSTLTTGDFGASQGDFTNPRFGPDGPSQTVTIISDPTGDSRGEVIAIHYVVNNTDAGNHSTDIGIVFPSVLTLGQAIFYRGDFYIDADISTTDGLIARKLLYWQTSNNGGSTSFAAELGVPGNHMDCVAFSQDGNQSHIFSNLATISGRRWYTLEFYIKLNSSLSAADGIMQVWLDDVLLCDQHAVQWTNPAWGVDPSTVELVNFVVGEQLDINAEILSLDEYRYWDYPLFATGRVFSTSNVVDRLTLSGPSTATLNFTGTLTAHAFDSGRNPFRIPPAYTVTSSDATVLTATVSGATVTLTTVGTGTANVTVSSGGVSSAAFAVTVAEQSLNTNFRTTLTFLPAGADGANTIFENGFSTTYPQPSSFPGLSEGFGSTVSSNDNDATADPRLAGSVHVHPLLTNPWYRQDCSFAGAYDLDLALGDLEAAVGVYCQIVDGASSAVLGTIGPLTTGGAGHFVDATGVERTSAADWIANRAKERIALTGPNPYLLLVLNYSANSDFSYIAHTGLTRVTHPTTTFVEDTTTGDTTDITTHTGAIGATWAISSTFALQFIGIVSGWTYANSGALTVAVASGVATKADYTLTFDLRSLATFDVTRAGVVLRSDATADTAYHVWYHRSNGWSVDKHVAGTVTTLATDAGVYASDGTTHHCVATIATVGGDTVITLTVDGTALFSGAVTDSSSPITAIGRIGLRYATSGGATSGTGGEQIGNLVAAYES